jgi:putative FmdB family regulatory protein
MPIYAYKCESCGHAKDVLQKISDAPLTVCPQCGEPAFKKQVTAAGFQLKGSGWYVTDFRGGSTGAPASAAAPAGDTAASPASSAKPADSGASAPATTAAAPAPAPAAPATSSGGNSSSKPS